MGEKEWEREKKDKASHDIPENTCYWVNQSLSYLRLHQSTLIAPRGLGGILRLLDLPNHQVKCLGDIEVKEGTGLGKCTVDFLCQLAALINRHLSLFGLQIALVAHYHQRHLVRTLSMMCATGQTQNSGN